MRVEVCRSGRSSGFSTWYLLLRSGTSSAPFCRAIEDGSPIVYDCSADGIHPQPFEVWMLDSFGALGVKRLKPKYREHIAGVIVGFNQEGNHFESAVSTSRVVAS
jgi:hypothetical protein